MTILFRSENPNCEVVELENGEGALVAIQDIAAGEWYSIAPSDSDCDSECECEDEEEEEEEEDDDDDDEEDE